MHLLKVGKYRKQGTIYQSIVMNVAVARSAVSVLGTAFALVGFVAPISTFRRIARKKSTESFSDLPYVVALHNCLIYMWYASPLVSDGWKNVTVLAINSIGLAFEATFVAIFYTFTNSEHKRKTASRVTTAAVIATATIAGSMALQDKTYRRFMVGGVGMVATVILYAAPLSVIRLVINTKSSEFIPVYLSISSLLGSCSWLAYGALGKDIIIMAPNFLGLPLALAQIVLYMMYHPKKQITAEETIADCKEMSKKLPKPNQVVDETNKDMEHNVEEEHVVTMTEITVVT